MPDQEARRRRVTMKDVARRAGVSQPTVSFVLNDRRDVAVAEATRQRVLEAAAELEFRPNRAAQSLRSNRPYTIGVIADGIVSQPYAGLIVTGIQQAVQPAGYVCYVVETTNSPSAISALLAQGVAGIIYASPGADPVHVSPLTAQTPTVFVNCWPDSGEDGCIVLAGEYDGGRAAAEAVFALGHQNVAYLGGPKFDYACMERRRGLADAAAAAGISARNLRHEYGTYHIGSGYQLALRVLAGRRPTALICGNDRMAVGALLAVHALGLECPRDISIVGFDDQPDIADQIHPGLTTIALPHRQMGFTAGTVLLEPGELEPGRRFIDCHLITRESLAVPADIAES